MHTERSAELSQLAALDAAVRQRAMEMFREVRKEIDRQGGKDIKLWIQLNKIQAPVHGLKDGASFIHSDLPPNATYIPSVAP